MKKYLVLMLAALLSLGVNAQKNKVFYDSKSDIIGISGHADAIVSGFDSKFFKNDVAIGTVSLVPGKKGVTNGDQIVSQLNESKVGNKILKYILNKNGYISFDILNDRSLKNASLAEREVAEADEFASAEDQLKDNVAAQFAKNYIYLEGAGVKDSKKVWVVLRAVMDESTFQQVWNIISESSNPERVSINKLDQMDIPVELVKTGVSPSESEARARTLRDLGKQIPDFAVRGQILRQQEKAGLYAACGTANGAEKLDQMYIYRQYSKDGVNYSKKLATARIVKTEEGQSRLFTVSGGWANSKKGDIAVLHNDAHQSSNVLVAYQNKSFDITYQHESLLGMNQNGMASYLIIRAGLGWFLPSESKLSDNAIDVSTNAESLNSIPNHIYYREDKYDNLYMRYFDNWDKPIVAGLGFGYGASWSFAHIIEVMPYAMVEAQYLYGAGKEKNINAYNAIGGRVPVGCKVNLNIPTYKCQLTAGVEYNVVHFGLNEVYGNTKETSNGSKSYVIAPYSWWNKGVAEPNHMRRTGFRFYAGLRFNY